MHKRVTLRDVAREAGVSAMTVSNVINRKFRHVNDDTRRRVEAAIEALDYRLDAAGRNLRLARRFSIGMIVVDPSPAFIADAFTTNLVAGLSNHLSRRGYGLVVQGTNVETFDDIGMLRHRQTDALCIMASGDAPQRTALYRKLARQRQPAVVFQERVPADLDDAVSIRQDDSGGAAMLVRRLGDRGCRRLVLLTLRHAWPALEDRERGVRAAALAIGRDITVDAIRAPSWDYDAVQRAVAAYVADNGLPDAIIAGNDQMGIATLNWLGDHGFAVPGQVRVTGFNAFEFWRYVRPTLTTVRSPTYRMGELGAETLLSRLESGRFDLREIVLPVELQPGESA